MRIRMKKTFKAKEAYCPIISVNEHRSDLKFGEYLLIEENTVGRFLLDIETGKTFFVPNQEYDKCVDKGYREVKKENKIAEPMKRTTYVSRYEAK